MIVAARHAMQGEAVHLAVAMAARLAVAMQRERLHLGLALGSGGMSAAAVAGSVHDDHPLGLAVMAGMRAMRRGMGIVAGALGTDHDPVPAAAVVGGLGDGAVDDAGLAVGMGRRRRRRRRIGLREAGRAEREAEPAERRDRGGAAKHPGAAGCDGSSSSSVSVSVDRHD